MTAAVPITEKNLDGYDAPVIPWAKVRVSIAAGIPQAPGTSGPNRHTCWLATVNQTGTPHVTGVGVMFHDDKLYFTGGPKTRKAKNIARNPRCAISVATQAFDLVFEGEAVKVTDAGKLEHVAELFRNDGWPATARDGALWAEYSAQTAGPPPWYAYELAPTTVYGLGTEGSGGAMRWDF
jgi:nitroimidazol reductase NimA-like FMN-containing flavoprotein (pyridoxamine 5'-phosphate oxidase superfamily)